MKPSSACISKNTKKTVNISEIFKDPGVVKARHSRRHHRRAPEHDLFIDYQESLSHARDVTSAGGKAKVSKVHAHLISLVDALESKDQTFKESYAEQAEDIFRLLVGEKTSTSTIDPDDGSETKSTVIVSKRMAAFKKTVEGGKRELDSCWAEWMRGQKQIEALGVEVLGHDAFVGNPLHNGYQQKDNQAEMIEMEFQRKLQEIEKSIGGIAGEFIKEMIKSEKELDQHQRAEQKNLLRRAFGADE